MDLVGVNLIGARWHKSSHSGNGEDGTCVEVALLPDGPVAVRDTKDRSLAPQIHTAPAWAAFLAAVRAGEFGR